MNILRQFNYGLKKTSVFLNSSIFSILKSKKIDEYTLEKIEEVLLSSDIGCLLYTSPSPRDGLLSRMPSSA